MFGDNNHARNRFLIKCFYSFGGFSSRITDDRLGAAKYRVDHIHQLLQAMQKYRPGQQPTDRMRRIMTNLYGQLGIDDPPPESAQEMKLAIEEIRRVIESLKNDPNRKRKKFWPG